MLWEHLLRPFDFSNIWQWEIVPKYLFLQIVVLLKAGSSNISLTWPSGKNFFTWWVKVVGYMESSDLL